MGTIIQDFGPIYGEVVNGTVQGRPNGSVYVPITNTITLSLSGGTNVIGSTGTAYQVWVKCSAISQDLASNIRYSLYSDAELTTQVGTSVNVPAGMFNESRYTISYGADPLTSEESYYVVAELINNGVPVARSDSVEVVAE